MSKLVNPRKEFREVVAGAGIVITGGTIKAKFSAQSGVGVTASRQGAEGPGRNCLVLKLWLDPEIWPKFHNRELMLRIDGDGRKPIYAFLKHVYGTNAMAVRLSVPINWKKSLSVSSATMYPTSTGWVSIL